MVHKAYDPKDPKPTAHIAVNKNRLKVYHSNTGDKVFLKDRQTFQIEIYNPTQKTLLAVFYINGTQMPGGGLILRPAERVFLDRYLTEKRKLMFNTYVASGNSEEVARAIMNNGKIEVKFYEEWENPDYSQYTIYTYTYTDNTWRPDNQPFYGKGTGDFQYQDNININYSSEIDNSLGFMDMELKSRSFTGELNKRSKSKSIETGRIDKGAASKQELQYVDKTFSPFELHSVEIQLLPISQKQSTGSSIKRRVYCSECGARASRTGAKFCSQCGARL